MPSIKTELEGFNRGTKNMLRGTYVDYTDHPAHGFSTRFGRTGDVTVQIPEIRVDVLLAEQEFRSSMGRHEAREFVRGRSWRRNHKGPWSNDQRRRGQIGSSHMPGVLYDERIFRSQLSNRLGLRKKWNELPLSLDGETFRSPRDAYIGSKPLKYEFDVIKQYERLKREQTEVLRRKLRSLMSRPNSAVKNLDEDIRAIISEMGNKPGSEKMTVGDIRRYISDETLGVKTAPSITRVDSDIRRKIYDLQGKYSKSLYDELAASSTADDVGAVLHGYGDVQFPLGSELQNIQNLSPYSLHKSPVVPGRRSGFLNILRRIFGK